MTKQSDTGHAQEQDQPVEAALLIIGDEILSGRTRDANLSYLAIWLNEVGVQLAEVRVVRDIEQEIADAINALRKAYSYVFTTGGIGPTHDDITIDSIAHALDVAVVTDPGADALLRSYYKGDDYTPARQRMARVPDGATLIENPVSIAPGVRVENIFILAGVPKIMQAMLEGIRPHIKGGKSVLSNAVTIFAPESRMAEGLGAIQVDIPDVAIGSYPFFKEGASGTQIVIRSTQQDKIDAAMNRVVTLAEGFGFKLEPVELP